MKKKEQISNSKLTLGIALLVLGLILMTNVFKPQLTQSITFENEPVKISGFNLDDLDKNAVPEKIVIPELSIDLNVRQSKLVNGFWEVFEDMAGWGEGSGIPGNVGNQVVFAHATDSLFGNLKNSKVGMKVYIFTKESWFAYEISEIKEVLPSQTEVIEPSDEEILTMYTCSGFADSKRLIVVAKRS